MERESNSIFITGVAGLVGSRFAEWVLQNKPEYKVIGIDNLSGGLRNNIPNHPNFEFYLKDIESNEIKIIFDKYKPMYVCHYGAWAAECCSSFVRKFNYNNNLIATANIVNNCINYNVKRLLFTSTMAAYGNCGGKTPPFHEDDQPTPIDPYGVAKYACEMDIKIAGEQHGLDWCIIRPHNILGKGQVYNDKYRNVLAIWMYQALHEEPLTIFGDGNQKRAFSIIDDMLQPLYNALTSKKASKQIINLGGIKEYTLNEACDMIMDITGWHQKVYLEPRHEVKYAYPTYQKSIDLLNFKQKTDLKDGLKVMWDWVQTQPKLKRFVWENYEVNKGLYSYWKEEKLNAKINT
jgi:UDP-glucose 4-epimerase